MTIENDFIQTESDEVSVIFYDSPRPPKYFKVSRKFIKQSLIVIPSILFFIFIALLYLTLSEKIKSKSQTISVFQTPEMLKIKELESEVEELLKSQQTLSEKLSRVSSVGGQSQDELIFVRKPYGMKNLTDQKLISLDDLQFSFDKDKVSLKFQLLNQANKKVVGHIIVVLLSQNSISLYPKPNDQTFVDGYRFSSGEPFSVSRLRPTNVEFLNTFNNESIRFMVYLFNREGDLILSELTDNFNVGVKN